MMEIYLHFLRNRERVREKEREREKEIEKATIDRKNIKKRKECHFEKLTN